MHSLLPEWDLAQWLHHIEHGHQKGIRLGLARISEVAKKLAVQAPKAKVITVGGTNGKGSTVSALETLYHSAGYKVGSYTSPHLIRFNERIRVNLRPISDACLCQAFSAVESAREAVELTYFERTTLAALWYFKEQHLDVIILEVGMGGRLDATNCIDPDLSIITTVDYDHQEFLGDTLEAIGFEKAGILRPGKPFIYADDHPPKTVVDQASKQGAIGYYYAKDYTLLEEGGLLRFKGFNKHFLALPKPKIQLRSAAAALSACLLLRETLPLSREQIDLGLERTFLPGRLDYQTGPISFLYDVSHNAQSVRLLADTLARLPVQGRVHAVFSALKDKDIVALIAPMKPHVHHWYPAQLDGKRAARQEDLLQCFAQAEISVDFCYTSPLCAFDRARSQAKVGDLVLVYGSFYTVGQVMAHAVPTL